MAPDAQAQAWRERVDAALHALFEERPQADATALADAMQYSLFAGGKRLRPLLVYAGAGACGTPGPLTDAAACAVELIHTYSLIHDDLPAMDDDDLRRGQPTCHRAFDEATAILAGDALQCLAFELLADGDDQAPVRLQMSRVLARASGMQGMVLGQSIDLAATGRALDERALSRMHQRKTGALIRASIELGALSVGETDQGRLQALRNCGDAIGLAFQIRDDILDETATTAALGKSQGADRARAKPTYTSMLGIERAGHHASLALDAAMQALQGFGPGADSLRHLARQAVARTH